MDKKELKQVINELKPQFNLGKSGMTPTFIDTVDKYIEAHRLVKIKVLAAVDKEEVKYYANELSKETDSEVVEVKGFTFTLLRD